MRKKVIKLFLLLFIIIIYFINSNFFLVKTIAKGIDSDTRTIAQIDKKSKTSRQVLVRNRYTSVYNPLSRANWVDATYYPLPQGTMDYIQSSFSIRGVRYFRLKSGRRVLQSQVSAVNAVNQGANKLSGMTTTITKNKTTIKMKSKWKAPFNVSFTNLKFRRGQTRVYSRANNYSLSQFNSKQVVITFDYANSAPSIGKKTFAAGPLFTKARFARVKSGGITRYKLYLTLRKPGTYRGVNVRYDKDNNIIFEFNNPKASLKGMKIYIDIGHGGTDPGAVGSYLIGNRKIRRTEAYMNYKLALRVRAKLRAKGANVIMPNTYTNRRTPRANQRMADVVKLKPELFISIHHNAARNRSSGGTETYYNTPFSKGIAETVANRMGNYFNGGLYARGRNRNRGNFFSYFWVTTEKQFPSILTEAGFMSNPFELRRLDTIKHRNGMATAITNGIEDYVKQGVPSKYFTTTPPVSKPPSSSSSKPPSSSSSNPPSTSSSHSSSAPSDTSSITSNPPSSSGTTSETTASETNSKTTNNTENVTTELER